MGTTCEIQNVSPGDQGSVTYALRTASVGSGSGTWRLLAAPTCGSHQVAELGVIGEEVFKGFTVPEAKFDDLYSTVPPPYLHRTSTQLKPILTKGL